MSKTFVIADTHFNHKNIIRYCNRPFADVEEMNAALIANWNSVVSDEDIVIHLGDIAMSRKKHEVAAFIKQLKGRKWLVTGNHDEFTVADYYEMGFEYVSRHPIIFNQYFILSHEPIFITESMPYANIYGHVHDNPMYKDKTENTWCVSVERINYTPIELSEFTFTAEHANNESAKKIRRENIKNQEVVLGEIHGETLKLDFKEGRAFVQAGNVRLEFDTLQTTLASVVAEVKNTLSDMYHPFTLLLKVRLNYDNYSNR